MCDVKYDLIKSEVWTSLILFLNAKKTNTSCYLQTDTSDIVGWCLVKLNIYFWPLLAKLDVTHDTKILFYCLVA